MIIQRQPPCQVPETLLISVTAKREYKFSQVSLQKYFERAFFFQVFFLNILELCTMAERKLLTSQVILSSEFLLNCWALWLLLKFPLKLARAAGSQLAGKQALKQCRDQERSREEEQKRSIRILIWFKRQWMLWMQDACVDLKRERTSSEKKNPARVN